MSNKLAWFFVAGTIVLTMACQLVLKWRVGNVVLPAPLAQKMLALGRLFVDPWVLGTLSGAVIASFFWMAAMTRLPLSLAYPFTSLSFVIIACLSITFLGEPISLGKAAGILLVVAGLIALARS